MKFKPFIAIAAIVAIFAFPVCLFAQEQPAAPAAAPAVAPEAKAEVKADAPKDAKIGKELDQETIANLIQLIGEAAKQKGSFWLNPSLWEIGFTILLLVLGAIATKYGWDQKSWGNIIKIISQAVSEVEREFIREAKAKSADGKLTKEEVGEALEKAWAKALEIAKTQGIDLVKYVSKEYFPVLVERLIALTQKK
jgi:hypothetical protein